ncbi:peroxisomal membrane protein 2-like [Mizuhopecten yessoensis]|uniref:Sphingomyelin phosphodiesterase 4 n=1 Tax=Mizuhopecten yessoensis TaxID=6573 RepID=A0A210QYV5_MIZYE|nr:peroxisomal membrane protein 2-like [Mizuhopecten yessoensis]OWF53885.1 Sphingomyelin phosphodiesterase 4 [Mizuhopecten yessoensis]
MSHSKEEKKREPNAAEKMLMAYLKSLQERPILTKACTSGTISAFGNFLAQVIVPNQENGGKIVWRSVFAYGAFGFCISGPLIHKFYQMLDQIMPKKKDAAMLDGIKRVLMDRLICAPPFLLLFLYIVPILEGSGHAAAVKKIKETFLPVLLMNWRVWTIFQFININYIPMKYRVLFGNALALVWTVYLATKRRQMAQS